MGWAQVLRAILGVRFDLMYVIHKENAFLAVLTN